MTNRLTCALVLCLAACSGGGGGGDGGGSGATGKLSGTLKIFQGAGAAPMSPTLSGFFARHRMKKGPIPVGEMPTPPTATEVIAGRVIVRTTEAVSASALLKLLRGEPYKLRHHRFITPELQVLDVHHPSGAALSTGETRELAQRWARRPGIRYAEADQWQHAFAVPNDKLYPAQWHYAAMNLPAAWDLGQGSSTVVVAVVDTGITQHPDLDGRIVAGMDMISDAANAGDGDGMDTNPRDEGGDQPQGGSSWHGTHVAGTIGASTNNDSSVAGVDWNARVQPVRVLGKQGGALSDIAAGIAWATGGTVPGAGANASRAVVVNMSLGGVRDPVQAYQEVIDAELARGAVIVVAAGNSNQDTARTIPCNQQGVICIGATRFSGARASYSNFGTQVAVMAPGGETAEDQNGDGYPDGVLSTHRDAMNQPSAGFLQGTSMATPHIAGLVALMKAAQPALTADQARMILTTTANPASKCNEGCGAGLVNAQAALLAAKGQTASGPPKLAVATSDLFFNTTVKRTSLAISNTGGQPLEVTAAIAGDAAGVLTLPAGNQVTVPPGQTSNLAIDGNAEALQAATLPATASAQLTLTSNGGNATVDVKVRKDAALTQNAEVGLLAQNEMGEYVVKASAVATAASGYTFTIEADPGSYVLAGAMDTNGNGTLDPGEPAGVFPTADSPELITLKAGDTLGGADFTLVPFKAVSQDPGTVIGTPCSGTCAMNAQCVQAWPMGYCTQNCTTAPCPLGSQCAKSGNDAFCLATCTAPLMGQSNCRAGYVCYDDGTGVGVCLPSCGNDNDCGGTPGSCDTATGYCK